MEKVLSTEQPISCSLKLAQEPPDLQTTLIDSLSGIPSVIEMPVIKAISTSISVARRHVLYILGIPALFVCLGPLVDTPSAQQLATTIAASDALLLWKAVTIYILYRYARWLTISAAYVAVDEVESRGSSLT